MIDAEAVAVDAIDNHGAIQHHDELAAFITDARACLPPDPIICEIGSDAGGTLWAWYLAWPELERLISISLIEGAYATHRPLSPPPIDRPRFCHLDADSGRRSTRRAVRDLLDGDELDLLFIDGDHTYSGAMRDCTTYGPMLRAGGLLALHDVTEHADGPGIDVPKVWAHLQSVGPYRDARTYSTHEWGGIGVLTKC